MIAAVVLAILVFCVVTDDVRSEENYGHNYKMPEYTRIKRAKYYSNPPMRFYRRPPAPHVVKGIFSYTPPPFQSSSNFMDHDSPQPGSYRPSKVSKRHPISNDGLGADDINNLVQHLSEQDLDKIIEFAGDRYKESPFEKQSSPNNAFVKETDDINIYKTNLRDNDVNQNLNGPYVNSNNEQINQNIEYSGSNKVMAKLENSNPFTFSGPYAQGYNEVKQNAGQVFYSNQPQNLKSYSQDLSNVPLDTQESMKNNQFSFVDSYTQQELYSTPIQQTDNAAANFFTDQVFQEVQLPKPVNLREDQDYEVSNSDKVPSVVKASSYKTENFGELPLMDYSSKLHTVSSYHVPHYSVISQQSQQLAQSSSSSSSSATENKAPKLELAPPVSAAKEQSDAHLKAIKIWAHRSKGTAYTLHDDGTLSLETAGHGRPKPYGYH